MSKIFGMEFGRNKQKKAAKKRAKRLWTSLQDTGIEVVRINSSQGRFFVYTADGAIGRQILLKGEYGYAKFRYMLGLLESTGYFTQPRVLVDIGANIGTHTIYALRSGLFQRALCFEPVPANFELLEMNVALNGFTEQAELFPFALSDIKGTAVLELSIDNFGMHTMMLSETATNRITVPTERLDDVVASTEDLFLHLDVEGAENLVLSGARNVLSGCHAICTELLCRNLSRSGDFGDLLKLLSSEFGAFALLKEESGLLPIDRLRDALMDRRKTDILFVRSAL